MTKHFDFDLHDNTTFDNLIEGFQLIGFDWRYLYVNKAVVVQSKNNSKEDLLGYTMMEKYPGIENTALFTVLRQCMKERVSRNMENEFLFPDNTKGWFELRIEPVPKGIFILSMDITERKRAEQIKEDHIQGLEEMIFMTSHKVRLPITYILGVSNLLNNSNLSVNEFKKVVGDMQKSVLILDALTKELTTFIHNHKLKIKS